MVLVCHVVLDKCYYIGLRGWPTVAVTLEVRGCWLWCRWYVPLSVISPPSTRTTLYATTCSLHGSGSTSWTRCVRGSAVRWYVECRRILAASRASQHNAFHLHNSITEFACVCQFFLEPNLADQQFLIILYLYIEYIRAVLCCLWCIDDDDTIYRPCACNEPRHFSL